MRIFWITKDKNIRGKGEKRKRLTKNEKGV
jgi:hypothetical protein